MEELILKMALLLLAVTPASTGDNTAFWSLYHHQTSGDPSLNDCRELLRQGQLNLKQYMTCVNEPSVFMAVVSGLKRAVHYCQESFKHQPWNCNPDSNTEYLFRRLQQSSTPETAYLRTVVGASIVYEIAKACHSEQIPNCPCGNVHKFIEVLPNGTRIIGGCDINIPYALEKTEVFMNDTRPDRTHRVMGAVNNHNDRLGKTVGGKTEKFCRCHGVTSSCVIKICHQKLVNFPHHHPRALWQKYRESSHVEGLENGVLVTTGHTPVKTGAMVHLHPSINNCRHANTVGRRCSSEAICAAMCCNGRYTAVTAAEPILECSLDVDKSGNFRNVCKVKGQKMVMEYRCQ